MVSCAEVGGKEDNEEVDRGTAQPGHVDTFLTPRKRGHRPGS